MNIIILDTETSKAAVNNYQFSQHSNLVFDIGLVVMDEDTYEIKHKYNAIVKEIYENKETMENFFFGEDALKWYDEQVRHGHIPVKPASEIGADIQKISNDYDVDVVSAYNATFDVDAIKDTWRDLKAGAVFDFDEVQVWDLYHMACQAVQHDENYKLAAVEYGFVTNSGNIRATAEAMYAYIKKDFNFIEDHTALSDAEIEAEILQWMLEKEKADMSIYFDRSPNSQAWRLIQ